MKIALDIHGVLDTRIDCILKLLTKNIHKDEFYVLSGAPVIDQMIELRKLGYDLNLFSDFYSIVEHLFKQNEAKYSVDNLGRWNFTPENYWWKAKAEICQKYKIDILIDNDLRYKQGYLSSDDKFMHFKLK